MTLTRVPTHNHFQQNLSHIRRTETAVAETHIAIASGKKAVRYSGISDRASEAVSLERSIERGQRFVANIDTGLSRTLSMETALNTLVQRAQDLLSQLSSAMTGTNMDHVGLATWADTYEPEILAAINATDPSTGRYLFAGTRTDSPPADASAFQTEDSSVVFTVPAGGARNLVLTIDGVNGGAPVELAGPFANAAALEAAIVGAAIPGVTVASAGTQVTVTSAAGQDIVRTSLIDDTTGEPLAVDATDLRYYQGDQEILSVRADETYEIEYGITGDYPAFDEFLRVMKAIRYAGDQTNPTGERTEVLDAAFNLTRSIVDRLSDQRGQIGAITSSFEQTRDRHLEFDVYAKNLLSDIEDVDVAEASTKLAFDTAQLEGSFAALARVSALSLLDYLR